MMEYFTLDELTQEGTNVTGRRPKGMNEPINALDDERIEAIRQTVMGYASGSHEDRMKKWRACTNAMSKKMSVLKQYARLRR